MINFQSPENIDFDIFFSVLLASLEEQILGATHAAVLQVPFSREESDLGPSILISSFGWALSAIHIENRLEGWDRLQNNSSENLPGKKWWLPEPGQEKQHGCREVDLHNILFYFHSVNLELK